MRLLILSDYHEMNNKLNKELLKNAPYDFCVSLGNVNKDILHSTQALLNKQIFVLHSDEDERDLSEFKSAHGKIFDVCGKSICGVEYGKNYEYWSDKVMHRLDDVELQPVDILFSHHSPQEHVDEYGFRDRPDYIVELVKRLQPKINIHGHDLSNVIGTTTSYQVNPIYTIGVVGVAMIEFDEEFGLKQFVLLD